MYVHACGAYAVCVHAPVRCAEWNIIYDKLAKCAESGAKIVLSRYAIGDLATQYFADRDIFCAGRVSQGERRHACMAHNLPNTACLGALSGG